MEIGGTMGTGARRSGRHGMREAGRERRQRQRPALARPASRRGKRDFGTRGERACSAIARGSEWPPTRAGPSSRTPGTEPEPDEPVAELRQRRRIGLRPYADEMEAYRWSFLLLDDYNDIIAWNSVAEAVAELNFAEHFETLGERNVVAGGDAALPRSPVELDGPHRAAGVVLEDGPPFAPAGHGDREQGQGAAPLVQMMMALETGSPTRSATCSRSTRRSRRGAKGGATATP